MKNILIFLILAILINEGLSQGQPWRQPLKICTSSDGINFSYFQTFQDSAGVPCVTRLPNGDLISAFQWFRQPVGSPTWDRVAVKFSHDNGLNWTQPQPVIMNGFPQNFTRPFDPALAVTDSGKIRMFYSSELNLILDTSINTYSAVSDDGINYTFEGNVIFSLSDRPVIDPAVIKFNNLWHLVNPGTAGNNNVYHNVSNNGIDFSRAPDIISDMYHSWTGNFLIFDPNELRFYGSGMGICYSSSPNGGMWSSFAGTNVMGGDPAVIKTGDNNFLMIYTGPPNPVSVNENVSVSENFKLHQNYPNPFNPQSVISYELPPLNPPFAKGGTWGGAKLIVYDVLGNEIATLVNEKQNAGSYSAEFDGSGLSSGVYF
ncbi:MAG: exo-alpha-sialidase [Bacteroidetes bacterium]|nr:exo-alpha-sialidase [Bacteroidota bacterium]